MTYQIKELFYSIQGEGRRTGRCAVFCRFSGCNLWSGRESDRANAVCSFCDTDFVGTDGTNGGRFSTAESLTAQITQLWPSDRGERYVVLTGGEPLLQVDAALIEALHSANFEIAVETNGSVVAPPGIDWLCVSPKSGSRWIQRCGDELKLVFPQQGLDPAAIENVEFDHFSLQPMDGSLRIENTRSAIEFCMANPTWRLSVQTHKVLEIR